jgi:hypothetical protein
MIQDFGRSLLRIAFACALFPAFAANTRTVSLFLCSSVTPQGPSRTFTVRTPPRLRALLVLGLLMGLCSIPTAVLATTIEFEVTDLPDDPAGEDLWRYSYRVSDFDFDSDFGFSIFFDYELYGSLREAEPVNADWDVLLIQADPALRDDGIYDALALSDNASLGDSFAMTFVWLGPGSPGPQPFEVYGPGFEILETGTTRLTPEPAAGLLIVVGLLLLRRTRQV